MSLKGLNNLGPGCATFNALIEITNFASKGNREFISDKSDDYHDKSNEVPGRKPMVTKEKDFWSENEPWGKDA